MTRYVVLEPPPANGDPDPAGGVADGAAAPNDRAIFVRDGFSVWAFLFSALWLLRYRLWLAAVVTLVLVVGLSFLDAVPGFGPAVPILELLVGLLVGLEGPSLRIEKLRRQGWTEAAAFHADDRDEAEIVYYAGKASGDPSSALAGKAVPPPLPADRRAAAFEASADIDAATTSPRAPGVPSRQTIAPLHTDRFFDAAKAR